MNEYKILLKNINKSLTINFTKSENILRYILFLLPQKKFKKQKHILKNISFSLKAGEIVGLIGSNGSGKSTLLRIISGIYKADSGILRTNGNILYINGFGVGLKTRLTMRDNIYLIGSIMGLKEKEIKLIIPQIADFSDLNEYLDTKIYQFSQGMQLRLSFSTIIFCMQNNKLDIVLLDEVFTSGGDLNFQKKASDKMTELIKEGAAIILVSHNLQDIKKYCNKTILLENGEIIESGETNKVVEKYIKNKFI